MRLVADAQNPVPDRWREHFELVDPEASITDENFYLRFSNDALRLCRGDDLRGICVRVEDVHRRLKGDFQLGRACAAGSRGSLHVLDAMAGLGVDGLALALRGHRVTLVERNVVLWALLDDLLRRLDFALDLDKVDLHLGDCRTLFLTESQSRSKFDVVYLDPMFPTRSKGALPGKNMQYIAALLESSMDSEANSGEIDIAELVESGRATAVSHVVLKRRRKDPVVISPDWQIRGRSVRYDMFRRRAESRSGIQD